MRRAQLALVVLLISAGCSGANNPDRSVGYIGQLAPIARDVNFSIAALGDTLDRSYESELLRSTALADVRIAQDLAIARDQAARLEPTPELQADQDRYLEFLSQAQDLAMAFDAAVAGVDLTAAALAAIDLETAAGMAFLDLSDRTCDTASFDRSLCGSTEQLDVYEASLLTEMQRLAAAYMPLLRATPAGLSPIEAAAYQTEADTRAAALLDGAAGSLDLLNPPNEFSADHHLILESLRGAAGIHRGEDGDIASLLCSAADDLSESSDALTSVFFDDDDLGCRG